jgi:GTP-binding protein LepA
VALSRIRNFSIIAHIDHGKSTLADRILQITQTVSEREMRDQVLDSMDLERERGITIKAQAVRVMFKAADDRVYELNLIDTPGHVDFTYEVSRSLAACEGALLVVDAAQGLEAQTLANAYLAIENDLDIVPVINKIDLPAADPDGVAVEVADLIGDSADNVLRISAKTGAGVGEVLQAVVDHIAPPDGDPAAPPRALIFDSSYDQYRGVLAFVRMVDGSFHKGDAVRAMAQGTRFDVEELGFFSPGMRPAKHLGAGEVGYIVTGLKDVSQLRVGDTLTLAKGGAEQALPGYQDVKPMVFSGLFPTDSDAYPELRDALERLKLNDAALFYEPETSQALGFGFRCGFLGLLHMEIVQERLEREFDLDLIASAPSVEYHVKLTLGRGEVEVDNPSLLPNPTDIEVLEEPWVKLSLVTPSQYIGSLMELSTNRRGEFMTMEYLDPTRVVLHFEMPLAELIIDYFDQMKSRSQGYASMDYEELGYRPANLVKVDILVNGEPVDALSLIVHRDRAQSTGRALTERLKQLIPRQMFEIPIQATIGSNVIARESVRAMRKNVLAKCYGGDITRKRKLLEKQKEGKQRMKRVGSVEIPQEAFLAMLRMDEG